jgi:putative transposase
MDGCWGSQAFTEKMLNLAEEALGSHRNRTYRSRAVSKAHDQREAERLLREGMAAAGLDEKALKAIPGSDPRKMALASLLVSRTVAHQSWIAERLTMCRAANVSQQVRRHRKKKPKLPTK